MEAKTVKLVGIEIECGIRHGATVDNDFWSTKYDGSVHVTRPEARAIEVVSRPFRAADEWELFKAQVKALYRNVVEINGSMGLHVHVSTENLGDLGVFATTKYQKHLALRIKANSTFKKNPRFAVRMAGQREQGASGIYTKPTTDENIARSIRGNQGDRYVHVNFCAVHRHGTMEIRFAPAMQTAGEVIKYVSFLLHQMERYARYNSNRAIAKAEVTDDDTTEKEV